MDKEIKLSPVMQQYIDIKNKHPNDILLYRMGDFYEMFFDDAAKAATTPSGSRCSAVSA